VRHVGHLMSKEEFERLFVVPTTPTASAQSSILERATIATLACTSFASVVGVVMTITGGNAGMPTLI
jgi:hypothetical protein